jgi:hypothetical protein
MQVSHSLAYFLFLSLKSNLTMNKTLPKYEPDDKMFMYLMLGVLSIVGGIYYTLLATDHSYKAIWIHLGVLTALGITATLFLKKARGHKRKAGGNSVTES